MKKSILSISLAALMLCFGLFGCSASDASSASSSASSAAESSAAASSAADKADEGSVTASVEFDLSVVEDKLDNIDPIAPYEGSQEFVLEEGATAYDALVATGVKIEGDPSYVTSINGLAEGAAGAMSGWMYLVNDEMPSVAANEYELSDGDKVVWYYGSWS